MLFEFATAQRIVFGEGALREVPAAAHRLGRRALLVTGAAVERAQPLAESLAAKGVTAVPYALSGGEPTIDAVRQATALARNEACDLAIAFGGGSAIDAAKAVAALLANPGDPLDYLEVIGQGRPLTNPSAPFIAIPTTAGTGSEVTRNAVLASPERRVKASLRSAGMLPRLAVVDPAPTHSLPPSVTASSGLDAITQLIEPYVSLRANPMADLYCIEGLKSARTALERAWRNGADAEARAAMSWASLLGGLALANAGLGAVHGLAAPLGGMFDAPHGALCAALLPHATAVNVRALRQRAPDGPALSRYTEIARLLTGNAAAQAEDAAVWLAGLSRRVEIPPLGTYGIRSEDFPAVIAQAAMANSMKSNPVVLSDAELQEVLELAR
ncbi:MAG: iron-containing alcohol dehydrogenase [Bryobacteraceae bacterium]|jgi:alcohol dehydrogenase class IV